MTLEQAVRAFCVAVDRLEREASSPNTGMQVPFHGDFAALKRHPGAMRELRWWGRVLGEALLRRLLLDPQLPFDPGPDPEPDDDHHRRWVRVCFALEDLLDSEPHPTRADAFRKLIRDAYDVGARRPEENVP